ncbi:MAG: hypothetical protein ABJH05_14450 [Fulvivirga sp.]
MPMVTSTWAFIEFEYPVSIYENDFNSPSTDFVDNFFSISQPANFSNAAIKQTIRT